jgi:hypothetical protein
LGIVEIKKQAVSKYKTTETNCFEKRGCKRREKEFEVKLDDLKRRTCSSLKKTKEMGLSELWCSDSIGHHSFSLQEPVEMKYGQIHKANELNQAQRPLAPNLELLIGVGKERDAESTYLSSIYADSQISEIAPSLLEEIKMLQTRRSEEGNHSQSH